MKSTNKMKNCHIAIKTGSWCGDRTIKLAFPSHWNIETHEGVTLPELNAAQIEAQFETPVDNFKLESLLRPEKKIAIVIDDHTRPTPSADILRHLLGILNGYGIPDKNIKILVAIGTHILKKKSFMRNKLGDIMDGNVEIIFPDCRKTRDLVYMGKSNSGVPVYINKHFANADVKIAVSGIYPHDEAGFSGGAKILIGVLGLETLSLFHRKYGLIERGASIDTAFRNELEHFADLVKLDYSVNCIINKDKKIAGLYCGDFRKAFRAAAKKAQECLGTKINPDADVVIANAYPLDTSLCVLGKSRWPFNYCKIGSHKIILTALCDCSDDRIPLASSKRELIFQKLKKGLGLTGAKRAYKIMTAFLRILRKPERKWEKGNVIYITHIDPNQKFRPRIINECYVEYKWENIISELLDKMGHEYPVNASIYLYAPLLFPETNG